MRECEYCDAVAEYEATLPEYVDIIFDGPPGPNSGRFVEVETPDSRSIRFGEWVQRSYGYWALRINLRRPMESATAEKRRETTQSVDTVNPLDQAWDKINALGGSDMQNNSYDQGWVDAVARALEVIEEFGGSNPAIKREP